MFSKGRIIQYFESIYFYQDYKYDVVIPTLCLGTETVKIRFIAYLDSAFLFVLFYLRRLCQPPLNNEAFFLSIKM